MYHQRLHTPALRTEFTQTLEMVQRRVKPYTHRVNNLLIRIPGIWINEHEANVVD